MTLSEFASKFDNALDNLFQMAWDFASLGFKEESDEIFAIAQKLKNTEFRTDLLEPSYEEKEEDL